MTLRAHGAIADGSGVSPVINKPAGVQVGDYLIVHLGIRDSAAVTITNLQGFTQLYSDFEPGGNSGIFTLRRYIVGGEPASWTLTIDASKEWASYPTAFYNIDQSSAIKDTTVGTGNDATPLCAAVTTDRADTDLIMFVGSSSNRTASAWTAPLAEIVDATYGVGGRRIADSTGVQAGTGSSGSKQCTLSGTANWVARLLAIEPALAARTNKKLMGVGA